MPNNFIIVNHVTRQIETLMKIVDKYEPLMKIVDKHEALIKLAHQGMINQNKEQASKLHKQFEKKVGLSVSLHYKCDDLNFPFLIYHFLCNVFKKSPKNFV